MTERTSEKKYENRNIFRKWGGKNKEAKNKKGNKRDRGK